MDAAERSFWSARVARTLRAAAGVGLLLTAAGWLLAPARTAAGVLVAAQLLLGLGLGGLVFVAFAYVSKAGWSVALRRVPEAFAGLLPLGAAATALALAGAPVLYEWMGDHHDALLEHKAPWLNAPGFFARAAVFLALWLGFGAAIRRVSRAQDESGDPRLTGRNVVLSTLFLATLMITFSLASFDWIMSIEAHWFSTVFAIYCFSGLFLAALAAITLAAVAAERRGLLPALRADHLHDLGKLTFGFATFWAYIWFCQYMLIWYTNIPEEASYYAVRFGGAWGPLMYANIAVNWLVPFLLLLPRDAKRDRDAMVRVAVLLLAGRVLDLVLLVQPGLLDGPRFGVWELGPLAAVAAVAALALPRIFRRAPAVPERDPMLAESLHYHN